MGTEILRPQDCLKGRIRTSPALFSRRRGCNYGNSYSNNHTNLNHNPNPSPNPRPSRKQQQHQPVRSEKPDHKRRPAQPEPRRWSSDDGRAGLVAEKVTILRRGASLDSKMKSELSLKKEGGERGARQAQATELRSPMMTKCDMYAGSAFAVSPEPSSLPLPSFSKKKLVSFDDSATRDLRRLLRLDD
ncbi:uncharacterized protein LOC116209292 isoform X3 [Punica granatum]|uniref:Uncharacterized protein LOC116209292 isoform X2 n=1 Tax=Punica granatum TaxID=22663 RepID=A0A6P8E1Q1_PUNGR|nr:uncharacterized protein LOC116209292 isoform X2 [Punica granatum]XP_031398749.1 uncharacterized protein LOC116209292 isoform X3 [Punica granatum]